MFKVDLNYTGYVDLSEGSNGQQGGEGEWYNQNRSGVQVQSFGKIQDTLWFVRLFG